jgi:FtsH-binding integral membrane protein
MPDLQESLRRDAAAPVAGAEAAIDQGLRRYMLAVYRKVALGLGAAGAMAYATSSLPVLRGLMFQPAPAGSASAMQLTVLGALVAFSPIVVLLMSARALSQPTPRNTARIYWTVVALFGASMGVMVLNFTGLSIATTFAIAAAAFGGLSLFGYTTRKDLTALGAFLTVGLIGLIGTLVLNVFLRSPAADFAINLVGVAIFAGLIAYDTQRLKTAYYALGGDEAARGVASNYGALSLFINFLNLFQFLLLLMSGDRR